MQTCSCSTVCLTNTIAQLSIAERTQTGSLQQIQNQFRERFPERQNLVPSSTTCENLSGMAQA